MFQNRLYSWRLMRTSKVVTFYFLYCSTSISSILFSELWLNSKRLKITDRRIPDSFFGLKIWKPTKMNIPKIAPMQTSFASFGFSIASRYACSAISIPSNSQIWNSMLNLDEGFQHSDLTVEASYLRILLLASYMIHQTDWLTELNHNKHTSLEMSSNVFYNSFNQAVKDTVGYDHRTTM